MISPKVRRFLLIAAILFFLISACFHFPAVFSGKKSTHENNSVNPKLKQPAVLSEEESIDNPSKPDELLSLQQTVSLANEELQLATINKSYEERLDAELEYARNELYETKKTYKDRIDELKSLNEVLRKKLQQETVRISVDCDLESKTFENLRYTKRIISITQPGLSLSKNKEHNDVKYNPRDNKLLILSIIPSSSTPFGTEVRTFQDFLDFIGESLKDAVPLPKVSLGLMISDAVLYKEIEQYIGGYLTNILGTFKGGVSRKNPSDSLTLETWNFFSRIILIHAPFIDERLAMIDALKFEESTSEDQVKFQKGQMKKKAMTIATNLLITNSLGDETNTLILDPTLDEVAPDTIKILLSSSSNPQISTVLIKSKTRKNIESSDNLNDESWIGTRLKPSKEQLDSPISAVKNGFKPGLNPEEISASLLQISENPLSYEAPSSSNPTESDFKIKLNSVSSHLLMISSEILKQGILFPVHRIVGTTWDSLEGWDGLANEGICYISSSLGYDCFGYPNLIAYRA